MLAAGVAGRPAAVVVAVAVLHVMVARVAVGTHLVGRGARRTRQPVCHPFPQPPQRRLVGSLWTSA